MQRSRIGEGKRSQQVIAAVRCLLCLSVTQHTPLHSRKCKQSLHLSFHDGCFTLTPIGGPLCPDARAQRDLRPRRAPDECHGVVVTAWCAGHNTPRLRCSVAIANVRPRSHKQWWPPNTDARPPWHTRQRPTGTQLPTRVAGTGRAPVHTVVQPRPAQPWQPSLRPCPVQSVSHAGRRTGHSPVPQGCTATL